MTPTQEEEINLVLEMAEQLVKHGIEIEPWTEITLGNAAELAGRTHSAQQNYLRALELFRGNGDRQGEAASLNNLGNIAKHEATLLRRNGCSERVWLSRERLATDKVRRLH